MTITPELKMVDVEEETEAINIAVIGCGYWGINYVRLLSELPETEVVAVCDLSDDRLQEVERRFPGSELFNHIDDLLKLEDLDAAVVCTNPESHFEITSRLLKAGVHVLVEKPMTTTAEDSRKLIELAEEYDVKLMVGHIFLFNSGINMMKFYIDKGDVGQIYYLHSRRTNLGPIRRDVNAIWDLAPHDVAIFNYLLDSSPEWVSAVGTKLLLNDREDAGFIVLGYPDNVLGHIHVSWADPNKERQLVLVGSDQRIAFDDLNLQDKLRVFEKGVTASANEPASYGEYQLSIRNGDIISPQITFSEPLKNQTRHFLEVIRDKVSPRTDGWNGLDVVKVMEAIDASLASNGAPVSIS
ncbi:MAG: gfo/Idh/MocA family oxidoreductase [Chloroflexi bacterium]|nr:MAG: gfo/Idh/MocA family oxidoreductase [Chloroflexota bacterium]MBL1193682.1 gfo/Idh/MocA family oxidoreductase [Chloroflexota bacterium]NOH10974.1 Gfo/Idh/MocA family oxidoreductase [Chloroflexota bacterium]